MSLHKHFEFSLKRTGAPRWCATILFLIAFPFYTIASAESEKHFDINYKIILPEIIKTAMLDYNPDFAMYEKHDFNSQIISLYPYRYWQSPSAAIADFNGDKIFDLAIFGHIREKKTIVVFFSKGKGTGYESEQILVLPAKKSESRLNSYMILAPKSKLPENVKDNLKPDCDVLLFNRPDETVFFYFEAKTGKINSFKPLRSSCALCDYNFHMPWWNYKYIENGKPRITYSLSFSTKITSVVRNCDADFETWTQDDYLATIPKIYEFSQKQFPFAVIGDFNGDNLPDAILTGHSQKAKSVSIIILSHKNDYKIHDCSKGEYVDPRKEWYLDEPGFFSYLEYVSPKNFTGVFAGHPLELTRDAYKWSVFEKTSSIYYFDGRDFQEYLVSD